METKARLSKDMETKSERKREVAKTLILSLVLFFYHICAQTRKTATAVRLCSCQCSLKSFEGRISLLDLFHFLLAFAKVKRLIMSLVFFPCRGCVKNLKIIISPLVFFLSGFCKKTLKRLISLLVFFSLLRCVSKHSQD